jgi:hypothetical protein
MGPKSDWRQQWPEFTHNVSWVDTDSKQHSLTIRTDDLDELLATLTTVKNVIRASKAKATSSGAASEGQSQVTPATPQQPDTLHCSIHNIDMPRRWSRRTNGHYFAHATPDGGFCYGKRKS